MALKKFLAFSALAPLAVTFILEFAESDNVKQCYPIPNRNLLNLQDMKSRTYPQTHF